MKSVAEEIKEALTKKDIPYRQLVRALNSLRGDSLPDELLPLLREKFPLLHSKVIRELSVLSKDHHPRAWAPFMTYLVLSGGLTLGDISPDQITHLPFTVAKGLKDSGLRGESPIALVDYLFEHLMKFTPLKIVYQ
jgi:hypothetical protein